LTNGPLFLAALIVGVFGGHWAFLIGATAMALFEVVLQLTNKGSSEEKLQEWDREVERTNAFPYTVMRRLRDSGAAWVVLCVIWTLVVEFGFYFIGESSAKHTCEFLVTDVGGHPAAVLRIYGDEIICAEYDPVTKICSRKFIILKTGEPDRILELSKIGPLRTSRRL
jgi:hypothetical protein